MNILMGVSWYMCVRVFLEGVPKSGPARAMGKEKYSAFLENAYFPQWWYQFTLPPATDKGFQLIHTVGIVWLWNFYHVSLKQCLCGLNLRFSVLMRLSISPWITGPFVFLPQWKALYPLLNQSVLPLLIDSLWILNTHTLSVCVLQTLLMVSFDEKTFVILM